MEFEVEVSGLKFRASGDREDVAYALEKLTESTAALVELATHVSEALSTEQSFTPATASVPATPEKKSHSNARVRPKRAAQGGRNAAQPIDFRHDAEKFGFPSEKWNTAKKATWLLYVLGEQAGVQEASAAVLAETFNKHFKQFKPILSFNVTRDLGSSKGKTRFVNNDASKNPEEWYLLASGKKAMEAVVASRNEEAAEANEDS